MEITRRGDSMEQNKSDRTENRVGASSIKYYKNQNNDTKCQQSNK